MYGELVICYLFLAGAGAGACFVLSLMTLLSPAEYVASVASFVRGRSRRLALNPPREYSNLFFPAYAVSFAAMALGAACLALDLGVGFDRVVAMLWQPVFAYITVGAYSLAVVLILVGFLTTAWSARVRPFSLASVRVAAALSLALAFVVMLYTGLLLRNMEAVPLWSTPALPVLFVLSSLSCGIAIVLLMANLSGASNAFSSVVRRLIASDVACIVLEFATAVALVCMLLGCLDANPVETWRSAIGGLSISEGLGLNATGTDMALAASLDALLRGGYAGVFWIWFVMIGLIMPLFVELALMRGNKSPTGLAVLAAAAVLVGGFAMRYCIVSAGAHPVLVFSVPL